MSETTNTKHVASNAIEADKGKNHDTALVVWILFEGEYADARIHSIHRSEKGARDEIVDAAMDGNPISHPHIDKHVVRSNRATKGAKG